MPDHQLRTRIQPNKPCIMCGGPRDMTYAYTTNQGRRSIRYESRCKACCRQRRRQSYAANPERDLVSARKWKTANSDRISTYNRQRQMDPAHRCLKAYHQRLRKARMRSGQPDDPAIRAIYLQAQHENELASRCPIFRLPELGQLQVDHIMPLAQGGQHRADNLQILAAGLNMRKGARCQR